MKRQYLQIAFLSAVLFAASCKPESKPTPIVSNPPKDTTQVNLTPVTLLQPAHFPQLVIPGDNQPYKERIALGRMLYYDPMLSEDGSRACATCHIQSYGFTTPGLVMDMPVLPHVNLGWYNNFFWDGFRQGTLEDLMLFESKDFFKTDLSKFNQSEKYKAEFKKCFGVTTITYKEVAYALAQFVRTMISRDSKFDQFVKGTASLTPEEMKGYQIFFTEKGDCFHCHTNPVTTDNLMHVTGLDSIYTKEMDKGYYNTSGNPADLGKFRTPNLRNVALRNRFMHDGRFQTLREVIDFYDHGVYRMNNLDPIMTKPGKENGLKLTEQEKDQLVAFLNTFTDLSFINDTTLRKP